MAYFKCDATKITAEQMAAISAMDTMLRGQSYDCMVTGLDPLMVKMPAGVSQVMKERLFVRRIPTVLFGWTGKLEGNDLVIEKTEAKKPARGKPGRKPKSNTDFQQGGSPSVAE